MCKSTCNTFFDTITLYLKVHKLMENSVLEFDKIFEKNIEEAITKPKNPTISGIELTTEQW